jgi:hypothetical protein
LPGTKYLNTSKTILFSAVGGGVYSMSIKEQKFADFGKTEQTPKESK